MKKLGITIDGVIRNYLDAFDKQYRKKFIFDENIVDMSEEFVYKEPTEEDLKKRTKLIEEKTLELISLPVDSPDLLNHYQFNEIKEFENDNSFIQNTDEQCIFFENFNTFENKTLTPKEALNRFMYEQHAFKIFGDSEEFQGAMSYVNRIQAYGLQNNLFETVLISDLKSTAISANFFFLHKVGCRVRNIQIVKDCIDKWNYCDVLVDADPETLQVKPEGKLSIKIDKLYNQPDESDYTIKNIKELNNEEFLKKIFKLFETLPNEIK